MEYWRDGCVTIVKINCLDIKIRREIIKRVMGGLLHLLLTLDLPLGFKLKSTKILCVSML